MRVVLLLKYAETDKDLERYHNCYGVITKILDAYHYRVLSPTQFPLKPL
ncbi:MAG: hypothetical protein QXD59_08135 [Candidatus Caldarchaeum sp.]